MSLNKEFELPLWNQYETICGIDEAGRGPMAGPVVVASVIFPKYYDNEYINDSKKLSGKKRDALYDEIIKDCIWYQIEVVEPNVIDTLNIYRATQVAMKKLALKSKADIVLTDAMPLDDTINHQSIIKGDTRSISIAAASIIAKTYRDRLMIEYDKIYPEYGFAKHKGYGTKQHKEAIHKYGRCPIHRASFQFKD